MNGHWKRRNQLTGFFVGYCGAFEPANAMGHLPVCFQKILVGGLGGGGGGVVVQCWN